MPRPLSTAENNGQHVWTGKNIFDPFFSLFSSHYNCQSKSTWMMERWLITLPFLPHLSRCVLSTVVFTLKFSPLLGRFRQGTEEKLYTYKETDECGPWLTWSLESIAEHKRAKPIWIWIRSDTYREARHLEELNHTLEVMKVVFLRNFSPSYRWQTRKARVKRKEVSGSKCGKGEEGELSIQVE